MPGLPATPFLLVALWAFALSSEKLYYWLHRVPLLKNALIEARHFEEKRAIRPAVKIAAVLMAWNSVLLIAITTQGLKSVLLSAVAVAATAGTVFILWILTDLES